MSNVNENGQDFEARTEHARQVRSMFASIAARYDLLNHLLSANVDQRWRRLLSEQVAAVLTDRSQPRLLDVACGTGDLSLELARRCKAKVIGLDFCRPMLAIAKRKAEAAARRIPFVEADALRLPFDDATFDATTIAFGLRNLADLHTGLEELRRVVRPGGAVFVLEFSHPVLPGLRSLFDLYFTRLLPRVGGWVSGNKGAYEYLPRSVQAFPDQRRLAEMMREAGLEKVSYRNLTGGIAAIHMGVRTLPRTSSVAHDARNL
ncbi:bifunctional demethylmenaquinone methyltransferase/2-methoxy-6-polyprenyl-1,4-benzoquinol methylase UbiE [Pyrinomonas sp.]|uniref:bifunctional demethylmenaquinone methyltransferase/2-methoxy-6-polyprenyl-1,4-benzoquinol methylase UbiE n=1 Tax=Pyrinomonas sp. TaxID=2080306 RepID=UPI0033243C05